MPARRAQQPRATTVVGLTLLLALSAATAAGAATTTRIRAAVGPAGVLRIAEVAPPATGVFDFDPAVSQSPEPDFSLQRLVYDSLLRVTPDGGYEPGLAEKVTVVDPQTIDIRLHRGVKFQDGTDLDANAVKFSIERNRASGSGAHRAELHAVSDVEVKDALNLTIHLAAPIAGSFFPLLASGETYVVSPAAVQRLGADFDQHPVGAGPFQLKEIRPDDRLVYEKWDGYFESSKIRLARVDYVLLPPGPGRVSAMRAKAIDAGAVDVAARTPLEAAGFDVQVRATDRSMEFISLCKDRKPFDDVRVRRALNYALDRKKISDAVFDGNAEPQLGVWAATSRFHDPSLRKYIRHDPKKARALLRAAGEPNLTFGMFIVANIPEQAKLGEIIQAQLRKVGVHVVLVQSNDVLQDYFANVKQASFLMPLSRAGLFDILRNFVPGSFADICNYNNPELNAIFAQLRAVDGSSSRAVQLWRKLQRLIAQEALIVHGVFTPDAYAWDPDRVANFALIPNSVGSYVIDPFTVYAPK